LTKNIFFSLWALIRRWNVIRIGLLGLTGLAAVASIIMPIASRPSSYSLQVNEVVSQDITAPNTQTYTSTYLTEQAQNSAENAVVPVYLPTDPAIARRQIERLRITVNFISLTRQDAYASREQKLADLAALTDLKLPNQSSERILGLTDQRWQTLQTEALNVLEQIMRATIRDDGLDDARRGVIGLISYSIPQDQAVIISELVTPFITPNSLFSAEKTSQARLEARSSITPITRTYITGEVIARRGQVISPVMHEALQQFGLVSTPNDLFDLLAAFVVVLLVCIYVGTYFNYRQVAPMNDFRSLLLMSLTFLVFLFGARFIIPNRTILPYIFPLSALGLTLASLYKSEIGFVFSLSISVLASFGLPNSLALTLFYIFSTACGILVLGKGRRIIQFLWAGLTIGLVGSVVITAYRLTEYSSDWIGLATLIGASFFNGLAAASVTVLLQFVFSQLLGLTTALQLMELARPDHPLLQFLLRNAPGTYQHSLQVANLAEQAAEAIQADAMLVRVGCLYHDVGKAVNPAFFVENQVGQLNSHDDIEPSVSAATIIRHVTDGVHLGTKHRLPPRIMDFMREHHGTLLTRYQYTRAVQQADNNPDSVDTNLFRYPGPAPRSRETAILMLADNCEARARAEIPRDEEALRAIVRKVFDFCQKEGQLNNTALTLNNLFTIQESFVKTLLNTYHPRILYPELKPDSTEQRTSSFSGAFPVESSIKHNKSSRRVI
jgi:putative nucleotidyltransferase with HDIG domain